MHRTHTHTQSHTRQMNVIVINPLQQIEWHSTVFHCSAVAARLVDGVRAVMATIFHTCLECFSYMCRFVNQIIATHTHSTWDKISVVCCARQKSTWTLFDIPTSAINHFLRRLFLVCSARGESVLGERPHHSTQPTATVVRRLPAQTNNWLRKVSLDFCDWP